ncbi:MAG: NUDIX domain-containing protein [Propionicimonas sp.]|uniref:NUDIX hydrolase n=1 Tax=Propionicimonas sp. TaxID=1955623 RepID=UPI002B20B456|nr:NUDIX domain-containing protein [Propionicimonas sp.]MEA4942915.1 NUDIX domain-containing protein [Propionicimonas sp.]MEA5054483.1 NUDIX domain-containing protein [Propionicimonas sp.]MEA5117399.1 NUDIX domain-containing protein [Propionicimonas sp.]
MTGPFRNRRFTPVPPDQRPRRHRSAARVLVTDGEAVLLLADTDPGIPGSRWWTTPGGGIEPGEGPRTTAVRELAEETGLQVVPDDLIGPVAVREAVYGYSDQILSQREWYFVLFTDRFEVANTNLTEDERITLAGHGWLPLDGLAELPDPVRPTGLVGLLDLVPFPERWPLDLGEVEESTLPVDSGR